MGPWLYGVPVLFFLGFGLLLPLALWWSTGEVLKPLAAGVFMLLVTGLLGWVVQDALILEAWQVTCQEEVKEQGGFVLKGQEQCIGVTPSG